MSTGARPDDGDDDYEAKFADIVARWDDPAPPRSPSSAAPAPVRPLPGDPPPERPAGDTPADPPGGPHDAQETTPARTPAPEARPAGRADDGSDGWRVHAPSEQDADFTPPTPAPLPRGELTFWAALIGLVVGPVWLLYLVMAQPHGSRIPMALAVLLIVGGFVALVARSPRRRRDREDTGDDGAVV